ncbi:hypothetical protein vseg_006053 [Gypsophila vaccaria]
MGEVREGSVSESAKKKHKKRKSVDTVEGLDEGGSRKKAKTDVVGDEELESGVRDDIGSEEGKSGLVVEDRNSSDKKEKKKKKKAKKSGSGDETGYSMRREASGEGFGELEVETGKIGCGDDAIVGDGKSVDDDETGGAMDSEVGVVIEERKGKKGEKYKEKKKKSKSESKCIGADDTDDRKSVNDDETGGVMDSEVGVVIEEGKGKGKKEKKKKSKSESKCIGADDTGDRKSVNDDETSGVMNSEVGVVSEEGKGKKDKKEKKKKSKSESKSIGADDTGDNDVDHMGSSDKKIASESIEEVGDVKKKKKKQKEGVGGVTEIKEHAKDKKSKKEKSDVGVVAVEKELMSNANVTLISDGENAGDKAGKKRKKKSVAVNTESNVDAGASGSIEGNEPTERSEKSNQKKTSKKVKFSDSVEVFSLLDNVSEGEEKIVDGGSSSKVKKGLVGSQLSYRMQKLKDSNMETNYVHGKRFSKEEDETIRDAVLQFVEKHRLGEDGVKMVMKCQKHRDKVKDCWTEIAEALPWRHRNAIYSRAHILFERSENRRWTKEELEEVRQYHEKYGPKWRDLADELGRNRIHVKDAFRQVKLPNKKTGQWSQEEYQNLFNLVNKDLRMRAFMDRKSKHGMLRDNIGWEAISDQLSTRTDPVCCQKWYAQLTSSLVAEGKWADTDDYRLLMALDELDATCGEDVDWDSVLEHRSGDVCRKRWNEMVRHIGEHGNKSFSEQVETLSQRYCPDVLDARETYDSKPFVDT